MDAEQAGGQGLYERIFACVRQVPPGRVTTYGTVGALVGCPARVVGYALHHLRMVERPKVPWHRVINVQGRISTHGPAQRQLLEVEGVGFDETGSVDLAHFAWP